MPRATLDDQLSAAEARVAELRKAKEQEEAERLSIVARAVEAEMASDDTFRTQIERVLDRRVSGKRKREKLGLAPVQGGTTKPSQIASSAG